FVQYIACLQQFANAGSTVMVDDFMFIEQDPLSSGGTEVQSLTQFLAQNPNVALFTSTGNASGSYWEGAYTPVSIASQSPSSLNCQNSSQVDTYVNQFAGGANEILTITPTTGLSVPITFAWADPSGQNVSNFDLFWTNTTDPTKSGCLTAAGSTDTVITQQIVVYPGTNIVNIATPDASLAGKYLKLWIGGDGLTALSISTAGGLLSPQTYAPGVITVGAVNGSDGVANIIEPFSGLGPITVAYPTPAKIQAPVLVAPDGIKVDATGTYFASTLFPDGNFYGTSASAPNAAGVAALLRGAFPNLTLAQLVSALQTGAAQLGASAPDGTFGYGRVDAMGALNTLAAPTMTITNPADVAIDASATTASAAQTFTVSGTGALHFSVASTNSALVPASVAAAGSPGVTVSPANCGAATLTCSLTVTAAQYQGGTATVTVSAVDGAGRAAPVTIHVTVTNPQTAPPPPPSTTTTTPKSGGGGGGSVSLWEILAAAVLVLSRTVGAAARGGRAISH
ncbi:MAG TPA: S8 family serine peptidase, partial [Steroidobacteraceae bacterium]